MLRNGAKVAPLRAWLLVVEREGVALLRRFDSQHVLQDRRHLLGEVPAH